MIEGLEYLCYEARVITAGFIATNTPARTPCARDDVSEGVLEVFPSHFYDPRAIGQWQRHGVMTGP